MIAAAASPSFAASATVGVDADTTAKVGDTAAAVGANSNASVQAGTTAADPASVVAAISSDGTAAASIQGLGDISSVTVIKVNDVIKASDDQALKAALAKSKADIVKLQAAIAANSKLKAKLEEKSVKLSSIVALNVDAKSEVTVFVE
ncbi:MAG: hypothetical protein M3O03_00925 [Pseudomonadota bacterium]|nr:hypothetical protein [Pseudomonadota bacterium]